MNAPIEQMLLFEAAPGRSQIAEYLPHWLAGEPIVVAYGMGVDSTAMLIGWHQRKLPRPDAILFADTGSEKPETYRYLDIINEWLRGVGYPQVTVIKRASPKAGDTSLYSECVRKSVLPSLAYGGHSCSLKWKVDPQWAHCRKQYGWHQPRRKRGSATKPLGAWAHGPMITKLIGYDAGAADGRRIKNAIGKWPPGHRYLYPLAEWGWDRARCIRVIREGGLGGWNPSYLVDDLVTFTRMQWITHGGVPMKSACFMCPASRKAELNWLQREHPELVTQVVTLEALAHARGLRSVKGLGRSFRWSDHFDCHSS